MITILSSIIGIVAKGRTAKAIAGGLGGLVVAAIGPAGEMFSKGFAQGVGGSVEDLGVVVGQLIGAGLIGYVITWLAPTNKP